jgi:AmmeMemoRadiSam system protein B/AmmeMemoRadiSam system protein A
MEKPVALIAPHAGYIFAGQIYADAYRQVMGRHYDVVVILGVNHTTAGFSGISLGGFSAFRTPLGDARTDEDVTSALLSKCKDCTRDREVHIGEHSIEVQIPFVQVLFPKAKIVPAILHLPDINMCTRFGQALAEVLRGRHALIVVSSDLSHYPDSKNATKADSATLKSIATLEPARVAALMQKLDAPNLDTRACGEASILAGMTAAKALGATRAVAVGYANSGDIAVGDSSRAVGYGAMVLAPGSLPSDTKILDRAAPPSKASPLQNSEKKALLKFARETIRRYLTTQTVPLARNFPARMDFPQGAFVTLKENGQLRGCIGHIPSDYELGKTVGAMAIHAAIYDPRFVPVQLNELENIEIEISVLTPMQPIASPDEIIVGRDGVVMFKGDRSAVFLPQVAVENHWDRIQMLENLCSKGGWPAGCWKRDTRLEVFQAEVFDESQFK